jgi:hypothetical protein
VSGSEDYVQAALDRAQKEIERELQAVTNAETNRATEAATISRGPRAEQIRWYATLMALGVWALYVVGVGLFGIFGNGAVTTDRTTFLLEVLKVGILPILTLAIGYYFGSKAE